MKMFQKTLLTVILSLTLTGLIFAQDQKTQKEKQDQVQEVMQDSTMRTMMIERMAQDSTMRKQMMRHMMRSNNMDNMHSMMNGEMRQDSSMMKMHKICMQMMQSSSSESDDKDQNRN